MNTNHLRALSRTALWLVASAVLAACGGGGGGGSSTPATVSGTSASGSSSSSKTVTLKLHFTSETEKTAASESAAASAANNNGKGFAVQALTKMLSAGFAARKAFETAHRLTTSNITKKTGSSARKTASTSRSAQFIDPYYTEGIAIFATDKGVSGAGPNTPLSTVYADVSDYDYSGAGIETCGDYGCFDLSPLCTFTDGGGVVGQGDPSEGWDCNISAPGVPGHTVTYQAVLLSDTPDNEATSGPGAGIGTGFSYGYELAIGTNTVPLNPTIATAVTITLDPINTFYCIGDPYYGTFVSVVPVDGNTHPLSLIDQAEDAEEYPIYLQTAGATDVFAGPDGTVEPASVTTGSSSLLSPNSATISTPNPSSAYQPCGGIYAELYDATCQGNLYANFTYSGAASGTSGAEPIPVTWDNQLSALTPIVGYGSNTGQYPSGPYVGLYESSEIANVIAPFDVTSSNQTLTASGPSTTLTVSLFCSGMPEVYSYGATLDYESICGGGNNYNPTSYGCSSNDYQQPLCFGTDIGSGVSGICPLNTVTVSGAVPTISSSLVVTQVFNATVTTSAAPPCIFHFTDEPAVYWWTGFYNEDYDDSAAIQVEPASGAVFPIHLGNPPPTPGNNGGNNGGNGP